MINASFGSSASYEQYASHLFFNLEDLVLAQTLSYRRKITYYSLLIDVSQNLISRQNVRHDTLHVNVAQQLA